MIIIYNENLIIYCHLCIYSINHYYFITFVYYYLLISFITIINKPHSFHHSMNPQTISIVIRYSLTSTLTQYP
jgi:hypothetical protein